MKRTLISFALVFVTTFTFAQDDRFTAGMKSALALMNKAGTAEARLQASNQFERIANAEPTQWLPLYYAAHCQLLASFMTKDEDARDPLLDKAQAFLDKAKGMESADQSEIWALQSYIYQGRVQVSPMIRGMQYGPKASEAAQKAIALNDANPRAHLMLGQNTMYTPSFFGGGEEKACPILSTAKEKLDAFTPSSEIMPSWGKRRISALANKCAE
ncbi:MAG: hypothetical protein AAGI38_05830 [Bacteroidota bacterium]